MTSFDYYCNQCGEKKNNREMSSFICECGGDMKLERGINGYVFQPFYSREMKTYITSSKHEERTLRAKGFAYLSDHKGLKKEAKDIKNHKNDFVKAQYASEGKHGWKPGLTWKDKGGGWEQKVAVLLLGLFLSTNAFARIEGAEYAEFSVKGEKVSFPIGSQPRKMDIYFIQKALSGDKEARNIVLGGQKERWFYIGDGSALWLKLTEDGEEIITP